MLKFDFYTYMYPKINIDSVKKNYIIEKLYSDTMSGFLNNFINEDEIQKVKKVAMKVRENSDVLIVIGIGGSFMGSYAIQQMFKPSFQKAKPEVIYLGTDLSSKYLKEVLNYIEDKEFTINVISKSGTTLEISLIYDLLKKELEKKYDQEEMKNRIIITTDSKIGSLREEVNKEHYVSFEIPSNIGGRYSLMTAAHLLPLAVMDLDIDDLLEGYKNGLGLIDDAYYYASLRIELFKQKKYIENFSVYEPSLYYYTEWIKQLIGESEGKSNKGIFPVSTVNTRDLHSLGQFIQQGHSIVFETVISVLTDSDIKVKDISLSKINKIVCESVCSAHYHGSTPTILIEIDKLSMENIGRLSAFFMLAAAFSAYLFEVDPFNQPGVEDYKNEVQKRIS